MTGDESGMAPELEQAGIAESVCAVLESVRDAVIVEDLRGRILGWNEGAARTYGYSAGEVSASRSRSSASRGRRPDAGREKVTDYTTTRVDRAGRHLRVRVSLLPVTDRAGHLVDRAAAARPVGTAAPG